MLPTPEVSKAGRRTSGMPGALLGPFGRYELGTEVVTIGRSSSNKVVIHDDQVSARHLQVLPQGGAYLLIDIGSSNGTLVNRQPLPPQTPRPLRNGDSIVIGHTQLTVEITPELTRAQPPATPQPATPRAIAPVPSELVVPPLPGSTDFALGTALPPGAVPPQPSATPVLQHYGAPSPIPQAFPPYPGDVSNQPASGYYPGQPAPGATPAIHPAAPIPGAAPPISRVRRKNKRVLLLLSAVLTVLVIAIATGVALYALNHRQPGQPAIPSATAQVILPFYEALKQQKYQTAARLFTAAYLQEHDGTAGVVKILQAFDRIRGKVTAYKVGPLTGSGKTQTASVTVIRDPTRGTFGPDTLQLIYQQNKWQINQWTPGQGLQISLRKHGSMRRFVAFSPCLTKERK